MPKRKIPDWLKSYRESQKIRKENFDRNKKILYDCLLDNGVGLVKVHFDGAGDSGQIEDVVYYGNSEVLDEAHKSVLEKIRLDRQPYDHPEPDPIPSLRSFIEQLCYDALEVHHPGWETNEGARGEFRIYPVKEKLELTFHYRVLEERTQEQDL